MLNVNKSFDTLQHNSSIKYFSKIKPNVDKYFDSAQNVINLSICLPHIFLISYLLNYQCDFKHEKYLHQSKLVKHKNILKLAFLPFQITKYLNIIKRQNIPNPLIDNVSYQQKFSYLNLSISPIYLYNTKVQIPMLSNPIQHKHFNDKLTFDIPIITQNETISSFVMYPKQNVYKNICFDKFIMKPKLLIPRNSISSMLNYNKVIKVTEKLPKISYKLNFILDLDSYLTKITKFLYEIKLNDHNFANKMIIPNYKLNINYKFTIIGNVFNFITFHNLTKEYYDKNMKTLSKTSNYISLTFDKLIIKRFFTIIKPIFYYTNTYNKFLLNDYISEINIKGKQNNYQITLGKYYEISPIFNFYKEFNKNILDKYSYINFNTEINIDNSIINKNLNKSLIFNFAKDFNKDLLSEYVSRVTFKDKTIETSLIVRNIFIYPIYYFVKDIYKNIFDVSEVNIKYKDFDYSFVDHFDISHLFNFENHFNENIMERNIEDIAIKEYKIDYLNISNYKCIVSFLHNITNEFHIKDVFNEYLTNISNIKLQIDYADIINSVFDISSLLMSEFNNDITDKYISNITIKEPIINYLSIIKNNLISFIYNYEKLSRPIVINEINLNSVINEYIKFDKFIDVSALLNHFYIFQQNYLNKYCNNINIKDMNIDFNFIYKYYSISALLRYENEFNNKLLNEYTANVTIHTPKIKYLNVINNNYNISLLINFKNSFNENLLNEYTANVTICTPKIKFLKVIDGYYDVSSLYNFVFDFNDDLLSEYIKNIKVNELNTNYLVFANESINVYYLLCFAKLFIKDFINAFSLNTKITNVNIDYLNNIINKSFNVSPIFNFISEFNNDIIDKNSNIIIKEPRINYLNIINNNSISFLYNYEKLSKPNVVYEINLNNIINDYIKLDKFIYDINISSLYQYENDICKNLLNEYPSNISIQLPKINFSDFINYKYISFIFNFEFEFNKDLLSEYISYINIKELMIYNSYPIQKFYSLSLYNITNKFIISNILQNNLTNITTQKYVFTYSNLLNKIFSISSINNFVVGFHKDILNKYSSKTNKTNLTFNSIELINNISFISNYKIHVFNKNILCEYKYKELKLNYLNNILNISYLYNFVNGFDNDILSKYFSDLIIRAPKFDYSHLTIKNSLSFISYYYCIKEFNNINNYVTNVKYQNAMLNLDLIHNYNISFMFNFKKDFNINFVLNEYSKNIKIKNLKFDFLDFVKENITISSIINIKKEFNTDIISKYTSDINMNKFELQIFNIPIPNFINIFKKELQNSKLFKYEEFHYINAQSNFGLPFNGFPSLIIMRNFTIPKHQFHMLNNFDEFHVSKMFNVKYFHNFVINNMFNAHKYLFNYIYIKKMLTKFDIESFRYSFLPTNLKLDVYKSVEFLNIFSISIKKNFEERFINVKYQKSFEIKSLGRNNVNSLRNFIKAPKISSTFVKYNKMLFSLDANIIEVYNHQKFLYNFSRKQIPTQNIYGKLSLQNIVHLDCKQLIKCKSFGYYSKQQIPIQNINDQFRYHISFNTFPTNFKYLTSFLYLFSHKQTQKQNIDDELSLQNIVHLDCKQLVKCKSFDYYSKQQIPTQNINDQFRYHISFNTFPTNFKYLTSFYIHFLINKFQKEK